MAEQKTLRGSLIIEVVHDPEGRAPAGVFETAPDQTVVRVGGDQGWSHIPISNPLVSRRHLFIRYQDTGWELIDESSSNGTFVKGVELVKGRPYPLLAAETLVSLGSTVEARATCLRLSDQRGRNSRQDLVHDSARMAFFLFGHQVRTTASQYRLLLYMYERAGAVCPHEKVGELCVRNWEHATLARAGQSAEQARQEELNRYAAVYEVINKVRKALADAVPAEHPRRDELRRRIKDHRDGLIVTHSERGYELRVRLGRLTTSSPA